MSADDLFEAREVVARHHESMIKRASAHDGYHADQAVSARAGRIDQGMSVQIALAGIARGRQMPR